MARLTLLGLLLSAQQVFTFVLPSFDQLAISDSLKHDGIPVQPNNVPKKIAIIGSGITGASAASRLYESFRFILPADRRPSITVFERNLVFGGRITQAYAFDDMLYPVDTCAATFDQEDLCIVNSALTTGLSLQFQDGFRPRAGVGIWDGDEMVAVEEKFRDALTWTEFRKDKWSERYGLAPSRFASDVSLQRTSLSLVLNTALPQLNVAIAAAVFNISAEVERTGLTEYVRSFECTKLDPSTSLDDSPESRRFEREIVNAGARERYFANGDELNVLEFYLGFQDQLPSFIQEGNIRLIERLLKLADADVRLGAEVQKIETVSENDIRLTIVPTDGGRPSTESFDAVILASPWSLANITFEPPVANSSDLEQKYLDSFVTHFTSSSRLNPTFFNRTGTMPQNVLTTTEDYSNGTSTFLSLTLLRQLQSPTGNAESLYKLVSREEIAFAELEQYLEEPANITWIDVQPLPRSVPVQYGKGDQGCRPVIEDVRIAPGIFYAGAGEQVIASADFGCRMGINAADLVVEAARKA